MFYGVLRGRRNHDRKRTLEARPKKKEEPRQERVLITISLPGAHKDPRATQKDLDDPPHDRPTSGSQGASRDPQEAHKRPTTG